MNTKTLTWMACGGTLIGFALGLAVLLQTPEPTLDRARSITTAPAEFTRQGPRFAEGTRLHYQLAFESRVKVNRDFLADPTTEQKAAEQEMAFVLDGALLLDVEQVLDDRVRLHMAFEGEVEFAGSAEATLPLLPESAPVRHLAKGCDLILDRDGAVLAVDSELPQSGPAYGLLTQLAGTIQTSVPAGEGREWVAVEQSPAGRYEATYVATGNGPLSLSKSKRFTDVGNAELLGATHSSMAITFDDAQGRLVGIQGSESTTMTCRGEVLYVSKATLSLRLVACEPTPASAPEAAAGHAASPQPLAAQTAPLFQTLEPSSTAIDQRVVGAATVEDVLGEVAASVGPDRALEDGTRALTRLAALLRLHPEHAQRVVEEILATPSSSRAHTLMIAALGSAGHEDALVSVGEVRMQDATTLGTLLPALAWVPNPSRAGAQFLRRVERETDHENVSPMAVLALGSLAGHAREGDPALASEIVRDLALEIQTSPRRTSVLLGALGNSGDPQILPVVAGILTGDRPAGERARAAFALRHVATPEAQDLLVLALADPAPEVRAMAALAHQDKPLPAETQAALTRLLGADPDAAVRIAAVQALTSDARRAGPTRAAFEQAAQADESETVRHLIAQALDTGA